MTLGAYEIPRAIAHSRPDTIGTHGAYWSDQTRELVVRRRRRGGIRDRGRLRARREFRYFWKHADHIRL